MLSTKEPIDALSLYELSQITKIKQKLWSVCRMHLNRKSTLEAHHYLKGQNILAFYLKPKFIHFNSQMTKITMKVLLLMNHVNLSAT
jgi:hypothetical protein